MQSRYYSNAKLILSGEYMVLHGASALVLPLKMGQEMTVNAMHGKSGTYIKWNASEHGVPWFSAVIKIPDMSIEDSSNNDIAVRLVQILKETQKLNPEPFLSGVSYEVITNTNFNINWGFGSSSALIANIAGWAAIDPYELHFRTSDGSGADIAGAVSSGPVVYKLINRKPLHFRVHFKPPFYNNIWLVYLGQKQNSRISVRDFKLNGRISMKSVNRIDYITLEMIQAENREYFMSLVREHENIISQVLGTATVRDRLFSDFSGEIKSLGAWGGDFIMAISGADNGSVRSYFANKGMHPVYRFDEIILC